MATPAPDLTLSGAWTQYVLRAYDAYGLDVDALCASVGADRATLEDPAARVPRDLIGLLWREAEAQSGDTHIGLHVGEHFRPALNHLLVHLALSTGSLLEALRRILPLQAAMAHGEVLRLHEGPDELSVEIQRLGGTVAVTRHEVDFIAVCLLAFAALATGERVRFSRSELRCAYPPGPPEHERVFGCPVRFGAAHDRAYLEREILERPLPHANAALVAHLEAAARAEIATGDAPTMETRVVRAVRQHFERGVGTAPELDAIARRLAVSTRTLQRVLAREGTSFTRTIDGQRRALAEDAIARGETAGRVAARLGFSDRRAFTRAFKRWTGRTPSDAASES